jgi:hypothetical protein
MVDDLAQMRGTVLVWAALGGGSVALPYLEEEAFGAVPARFRQYGFVNDSEFIAAARERGIDTAGIVFEAQAWEFAAELSEEGDVLAINQTRGVGRPVYLGLREFGRDQGPANWRPFRHYFPSGLVNSRGQVVEDLWEEVASRDLAGQPLHAHWVELSGRDQACYFADRNNPVWREYLKAIIRIQVDAGAGIIQLDETDSPMTAFRYGGCFCYDCMNEFRIYAKTLLSLPPELEGMDLDSFNYAAYLRDQGYGPGDNPQSFPLYELYARSQQAAIAKYFKEMTHYIREYAAGQGRQVRVAGNFYDCAPYYDPMVDQVDLAVTEMRETGYQQPWYFRHGVGLARGKPLIAVENPYGGLTGTLHERLACGKDWDRFRLTVFEAAAMGANMALPYGSWLGTEVADSYWVHPALVNECGRFLEEIDRLITGVGCHRTAVVYSVASMMRQTLDSDQFSDRGRFFAPLERPELPPASYWPLLMELSRKSKSFDVVVFPDEELRPGPPPDLARYQTLVLPDVWAVSPAQDRAVSTFAANGGQLVVVGNYGGDWRPLDNVWQVQTVADAAALVSGEVQTELGPLAAVNLQETDQGVALHVLNYDVCPADGRVRPREEVELSVALPFMAKAARLYRPGHSPRGLDVSVSRGTWGGVHRNVRGGVATVTVPHLETYAVIEFLETGEFSPAGNARAGHQKSNREGDSL